MKWFGLVGTLLYSIAHAFSVDMRSFALAIDRRHVDAVIALMESFPRYVDPTINGNQALFMACEMRSASLLKILLDDGRIDPAEDKNMAFFDVFQCGYTDLVSLFLKDERVNFSLFELVFYDGNCFESLSRDQIADPRLIKLNDIRRLSTWEVEYVLYVLKKNYPSQYHVCRDYFKLAALKVTDQQLHDDGLFSFYISLDGPRRLIEELEPHFQTRRYLLRTCPHLPLDVIESIARIAPQ